MIYMPYILLRLLIEAITPRRLLFRLPRRLQQTIWARAHGPLAHARAFPGINREWVAYDCLRRALAAYPGNMTVLEFGCAFGAFTGKLLSLVELLRADTRVQVVAFDTFSGMPSATDASDRLPHSPYSKGSPWVEGSFAADEQEVDRHLRGMGYTNFQLVKGPFSESLTDALLSDLSSAPPALVIIDCDYYSSTRDVLSRVLKIAPSGTVFYFDDVWFNWYSKRSGELRAIDEVNSGCFGEQFELVEDYRLGMLSQRVYRLVRHDSEADGRTNVGDLRPRK